MEKRLFLTGPSGCGKTTMLRAALGERLSIAGGFVTERAFDANGFPIGYDLYPAAYAGGVTGFTPARFLDYSLNPPRTDNEVFRTTGVRLLQEASAYPYVLLDEIGGFELLIPQFNNSLLDLLNSDVPVIGVFKSTKNAEELKRRFSIGEILLQTASALRSALVADNDSLVIETTGRGDERALGLVEQWIKEFADE